MSNFSDFLSNISSFNTSVLIPFIESFFSTTIGITFVGCVSFCFVFAVVARLLRHKF